MTPLERRLGPWRYHLAWHHTKPGLSETTHQAGHLRLKIEGLLYERVVEKLLKPERWAYLREVLSWHVT